jgi:uncharacterized Fe-S cluster protein YjdI
LDFLRRRFGEVKREYDNGEITILWQPGLCIHSTICFTELPEVFAPWDRPWVHPNAASTERIIEQIERCPSGALAYRKNQEQNTPNE